MQNSSRFIAAVAVLLSAVGLIAAGVQAQTINPPPPAPMEPENAMIQVSPHVYVIPQGDVRGIPNVGIVVGTNATLIIDTGLGRKNGEIVLREAAKVSKNGKMFVTTTHYHPEHYAGLTAFPKTASYIVTAAQQKDLDELGAKMVGMFASRSSTYQDLLKDVEYRRGDIVVDREQTFDLGGVHARVFWWGSMHTRGDTMVYVEEDKVLFAGDVVLDKTFLAVNRETTSGKTWIDSLRRLQQLAPTLIVPSHFALGNASLIDAQLNLLTALEQRVTVLRTEGRSDDEAVKIVTEEFLPKYKGWSNPERLNDTIRILFDEVDLM